MLIFQIKRIISSEKWFNYVVTFFLDDAKRRKKEDGLTEIRANRARSVVI